MSASSKIPRFERSIAAIVLSAKESVIAPMRPKLREYAVTEPQWRVLRVIDERGTTDATALAQIGLLHAASVARILKELEERGFVRRQTDGSDRRRTLVTLTAEGREIVSRISREVVRIMGHYADRFGPARLDALQEELQALSRAIRDVE